MVESLSQDGRCSQCGAPRSDGVCSNSRCAAHRVFTYRRASDRAVVVWGLSEPDVLRAVATRDRSYRVRREAVRRLIHLRLVDDQFLVKRLEDQHPSVRAAAVSGITDMRVVSEVAINDPHPFPRRAATERLGELGDRDTLAWLVRNDPSPLVRETAAEQLVNLGGAEDVLDHVVAFDDDDRVCLAAVAGVSPAMARRILVQDDDPAMRLAAVGRVDDEDTLLVVARTDWDWRVRARAVKRLPPSSETRVAVALADKSEIVRRAAVEGLTDVNLLSRIARTDSSSLVRGGAEDRLRALQVTVEVK